MKDNNPSTFLNFTGGIDSTHVLYNYLTSNSEPILVHHCVLKNHEGRSGEETQAVNRILKWLRSKGLSHFQYVQSEFNYGTLGYIVRDAEVTSFLAGVVFRNPRREDLDKVLFTGSKDDHASPGFTTRDKKYKKLIKTMANKTIIFEAPNKDKPRSQLIEELPDELLRLTWFCRRPNSGKPCQKCHTCKQTLPYL